MRKIFPLSRQLLIMIFCSALAAQIQFWLLRWIATAVAETYVFNHDIPMTEFDWIAVEQWIFAGATSLSALAFVLLFLMFLSPRIGYIRTIIQGIRRLGRGEETQLPLEGNNELTVLAESINDMSAAQRTLREKAAALAAEKAQFIRNLSHDIRTPLTAIMSYSEYLTEHSLSPEQQREYLQRIRRETMQIRDLSSMLLDGDKRNLEEFEDVCLLMRQLAAEFEEELEGTFQLKLDFSQCASLAGRVDVQEMRRIFDNLSSNIQKYADPGHPVTLTLRTKADGMELIQQNRVRAEILSLDSNKLGLNIMRNLAYRYNGYVRVHHDLWNFEIRITFALGADR